MKRQFAWQKKQNQTRTTKSHVTDRKKLSRKHSGHGSAPHCLVCQTFESNGPVGFQRKTFVVWIAAR